MNHYNLKPKSKYIADRICTLLTEKKLIESTALPLFFGKNRDEALIRQVVRSMIRERIILTKKKPFKPSLYRLATKKTRKRKKL